MREKGSGSIKKRNRPSGKFLARWCGFYVGTFDTEEEAEAAIVEFSGGKCPRCRQPLPKNL